MYQKVKSNEYGYGGIAQIFLKLLQKNYWYSEVKCGLKWLKNGFIGNALIFFLFFGTVFSKTRPPEFGGIHMLFGDKNLKHRGGFH